MKPIVDLRSFSTRSFDRGAAAWKEGAWVCVSWFLFQNVPLKLSWLKCQVLRLFGAQIGRGIIFKPNIKITFPWKLTIEDHVWLGEECWLLNLAPIILKEHSCISQRAFLCTGNHDYTSARFDLLTQPISVGQGAWVGAGVFIAPGVNVGAHAVLCAGSVATRDVPANMVCRGNPALPLRRRNIQGGSS